MSKIILAAGDSWTFGSEIRHPDLPITIKDWDEENDAYRLPRTWPSILSSRINAVATNISYPASSNDRIVRTAKEWLIENYISKGKNTNDILLMVGFTSPERKDFYYKDDNTDAWVTIWPMISPSYRQTPLKKFHDIYVKHMWNPEEYVHRYVNQILDLQNFCKIYGIEYLFFQAFYQHQNLSILQWNDAGYVESNRTYNSMINSMVWNMIDDERFMNKNKCSHSFHAYITEMDKTLGTNQAFIGQHPSEIGHTWWADHVLEYCRKRKII